MKRIKKDNKGFSLVELIIVIAIMAVLIGLLAPQYLRFVRRSRATTDIENANELARALDVTIAEAQGGTVVVTIDSAAGGTAVSGIKGIDALPVSNVDPSYKWTVVYDSELGVERIELGGFEIYPGDAFYNNFY